MMLAVFLVAGCTERIDIKTDDAQPRLVIYGYITSDTTQHAIQITRSAGWFATDSPEGVSNATVTVSDDLGRTIVFAENDTVPGLYQTGNDVYGEENHHYTLNVLLDSDGDRVQEHYSSEAYLQPINHIDSVALQPSLIFENTVEVLLYAQDLPGKKNWYSIFVAINDTVINQRISGFFVMDNAFFRGQYINGVACYYLDQAPDDDDDDEVLHINDKVTLNINAIPEEYALFISNVQTEIRGSVPVFGGPPANVETNIICVDPPGSVAVSGFFTAFPRRYANTVVQKEFGFN